jgi:hypothetical protein
VTTSPLYEEYGDGAKHRRSLSIPPMWGEDGLVLIVSLINDNLIIASKKAVEKAKKDLMERLTVKTVETLKSTLDARFNGQRIP